MLQHAIAAAALILSVIPPPPAASPTPQPTSTPALKTIATVRASSRCASIITHANSAISTALDDDAVIGQTITQLRLTNLDDGNPIHRRNGLEALGDLAKRIVMQARAGDDEVKRLRAIAAATKDPIESKALKAFADQLGGALWDQQKVGRDLNGFLAYQDFRDMSKWDEGQEKMNEATFGVSDPLNTLPTDIGMTPAARQYMNQYVPPALGHDPNEATATQQEKAAADDFQRRLTTVIPVDENQAAMRIDAAVQGC
ncbi:MAG TPA: hypothetical protein VKT72_13860 [Candidatus Baltobacteraceae bacterium]|nr:hypothetical protein [Candidatus Baltobacteraceae bacterium]